MQKVFVFFFTVAVATAGWSQVKIGDNPTTLTSGAVLEVEKNGNTVIVKDDGKVGIGTDAPNKSLHLEADEVSTTQLRIRNTNTGASGGGILFNADGGLNCSLFQAGSGYADLNSFVGSDVSGFSILNGGTTNNGLLFRTSTFNKPIIFANGPETMRVMDGKVGIGTVSPSAMLHVVRDNADPFLPLRIESSSSELMRLLNTSAPANQQVWLIGENGSGGNLILRSRNDDGSLPAGSQTSLSMTHFNNASCKECLGVGQTYPKEKLHIGNEFVLHDGTSKILGRNYDSDAGDKYIVDGFSSFINFDNSGNLGFHTAPSGTAGAAMTSSNRMMILNNGSVGIGTAANTATQKLLVSGNIHATGTVTQGSDRRLKSNIEQLPYGLSEVMQLQPKKYLKNIEPEFTDGGITAKNGLHPELGFIAQDVYEIMPEMVSLPEDENKQFWGLSYEQLIPVLTRAIQEQQAQIEALKSENAQLKASALTESEVAALRGLLQKSNSNSSVNLQNSDR